MWEQVNGGDGSGNRVWRKEKRDGQQQQGLLCGTSGASLRLTSTQSGWQPGALAPHAPWLPKLRSNVPLPNLILIALMSQDYRDPLPEWWPRSLRSLLVSCWERDPAKRPAMKVGALRCLEQKRE